MAPVPMFLLWGVAGVAGGWLHVRALRWAVERAGGPEQAMRRVVYQLPLRLLAISPLLVGAVHSGLWGCLGLMIGLLLGRIGALYHYCTRSAGRNGAHPSDASAG